MNALHGVHADVQDMDVACLLQDGMVMDLHRTLQSRVRLIRSFVREGVTSRGVRQQHVLYTVGE